MAEDTFPTEPLMNVEWVKAESLKANSYNPNVVFSPELRLLEYSILQTGWIQPILVSADNTIIDGFHRWRLAQDGKALQARYRGYVPVVRLPLDRPAAMLMTIRINRAKGTHVALRMSEIVHELIEEHHLDPQEIAQNIGAGLDEVRLLAQDGVFAAKDIKNYKYSKAWIPAEERKAKA